MKMQMRKLPRYFGISMVFLFLLFVLGEWYGSVVVIDSHAAGISINHSKGRILLNSVIYPAAVFLLGRCSIGLIGIPVLVLFRGFLIGSAVCAVGELSDPYSLYGYVCYLLSVWLQGAVLLFLAALFMGGLIARRADAMNGYVRTIQKRDLAVALLFLALSYISACFVNL